MGDRALESGGYFAREADLGPKRWDGFWLKPHPDEREPDFSLRHVTTMPKDRDYGVTASAKAPINSCSRVVGSRPSSARMSSRYHWKWRSASARLPSAR